MQDSFTDYSDLALRTQNKELSTTEQLTNAALGLAGEAGEFADMVKKHLFQGHPLDDEARRRLIKELGDLQWYLADAADALRVSLFEVAETNIEKLRARYPEGFSSQHSIHRKDS